MSATLHTARSGLGTEFGLVLRALVGDVAGARGAVLLDRDGNAIDYANDADAITELDLQIAGAQVTLALVETSDFAGRRGLGAPQVLVEGGGGSIMGTIVEPVDAVLLVLVLQRQANLGAAWRRFDAAQSRLAALLGG